jgi:hypothetical protein
MAVLTSAATEQGERMTTVLCHCRVADCEAWRRGYDHALKVTPGVGSFRAWRAQDDPSLVMVEETFDTREQAQAAWTSAETQAAMEGSSSIWVGHAMTGPALSLPTIR